MKITFFDINENRDTNEHEELIVGLIICAIWFLTIVNYSKRNKVKFDIINESEYGKLYKEEWKRISILTPLTLYEKISSGIFALLYIALFIIKII